MEDFNGLKVHDLADLEVAVERRNRRLTYSDERHPGISLATVTKVRCAKTDVARLKILSEARDKDGQHLDPDLQADYFERYRTGGVTKKVPQRLRPFRVGKIALARLRALPETFTLAQVVGTPTKPPWSLLRAWEAAERIAPTGRVGEWRKCPARGGQPGGSLSHQRDEERQ